MSQAFVDKLLTENRLLGGRLALLQPRKGYRAGLDAALLAAALGLEPGQRALEAGCGPGAALLQAAVRAPETQLTGVEREAEALDLAQRNIEANALHDRLRAMAGDVGRGFAALGLAPFDAAFANPPFFDDATALRGPGPAKAAAWLADDGLAAWSRFLLDAVRHGGAVTVIHRADRLADLLSTLSAGGGSLAVRPVQPFADAPAKRILVRAIKGGRAPLKLLPALVLHDRGEAAVHTPEADAILRGEASLGWS